MIDHTSIEFHNDRLKEIQSILDKLAPHEHGDGMNECHICDQELDEAILIELRKILERKEAVADDVEAGQTSGEKEAASDSGISSPQIALELLRVAVCPECDGSGSTAAPLGEHFVSHEMAMDAGAPSMEGQSMGVEWEQRQCQWCYQRAAVLSEHGVSSPGGGVSSLKCLCEPETRVLSCPIHGDQDHEAFDSPLPSPVEHVRQMERDAERYRFLRDRSDPDAEQPYIAQERMNSWGKWLSVPLTAEECDAVIDEHLKGKLSSQDGNSPATSVSSPESKELLDALKAVVASANPHPMEHGSMYEAWQVARKAIANAEALASPVSSVERDKKDSGEPGAV